VLGYLISEGFRNVFKNKKSTVASLIIMCATMFIFGIFFVIGENVNNMLEDIEKQQGMQVFIKNDDTITQEQKTQLGEQIRNLDGVNNVVYRTKDENLNQIKDSVFKDNPEMLQMYEGDKNPLQDSYVVTLTDLEKSEEVKIAIERNNIVDSVEIRSDTINTLIKIANGINIASLAILVLLVLISIFIITNTIKLTVHARRKEISIMKYVGATNGFIRWPFVVEGIIIGVISALISILLLGLAYNSTANAVLNLLQTTSLPLGIISFSDMFGLILIVYLALGIGIGIIGSMISMRRYLEV
jgi:cell division transport system permease protein